MKKENLDLVKQAIVNEYEIGDAMATPVAEAALEAVREALVVLLTKQLAKLKEGANETN